MLTWPSALPAPLWTPYAVQPISVVERTSTDDGKFRVRPRAKKAPYVVNLAVALDATQEVLARAFHEYALHQGSDAFLMRLRTGGAMRAMQVQFTTEPSYEPMGIDHVRMTFSVLVHSDFGAVIWKDVVPADFGYTGHTVAAQAIGDLTDFKVSRVYLFGREAFNGGTDRIQIGWAADVDALVESTAPPATGAMTTITSSGISLGVNQSGTKTVTVKCTASAAPTTGDLCIVIPFEDI
jgi:hypothetical protein